MCNRSEQVSVQHLADLGIRNENIVIIILTIAVYRHVLESIYAPQNNVV